jgi:hypothetical protein
VRVAIAAAGITLLATPLLLPSMSRLNDADRTEQEPTALAAA